jgi:hypothetical protein
MSKNKKGAFCQKCASQVHDFTNQSSLQIKQTLVSLLGQPICGRIGSSQEVELNADFNRWMNSQNRKSFQSQLLFALLIVFGLGLFSCESEQDVKNLKDIQIFVARNLKGEKKIEIPKQIVQIAGVSKMAEISTIEPMIMCKLVMEVEVQDTVIVKSSMNQNIVFEGAMIMSHDYENYLIEAVPVVLDELDENGEVFPKSFEAKVSPNPAREQTTFELGIPTKFFFEIQLFDLQGKLLQTIHSGELDLVKFRKEIHLQEYKPGMLLIIINSVEHKETLKFLKI